MRLREIKHCRLVGSLNKNNWSVTGVGMNGIAVWSHGGFFSVLVTGNSVFQRKKKRTGIKAMVGFFFMVLTNASTGSFGSRWKLNKILLTSQIPDSHVSDGGVQIMAMFHADILECLLSKADDIYGH